MEEMYGVATATTSLITINGDNGLVSFDGEPRTVTSDELKRLTMDGVLWVTSSPARLERPPIREKKVEPVRGPSVPCGRNAPCPCGSGKKFKRCHRGLGG